MAFQRKKPAAIGVKAPFPGFIEPALASSDAGRNPKAPAGLKRLQRLRKHAEAAEMSGIVQTIPSTQIIAACS